MSPTPSQEIYRQYLEQARERWLRGQTITAGELRRIYKETATEVARDISRLLPSQPSAQHLRVIEGALREASEHVAEETMQATLRGVEIATGAAVGGARAIAHATIGQVLETGAINAMYSAINQRAVLAFATRRRYDGLRLSDRVWRIGGEYRTQIGRAIEHGISRGLDSRKLARELEQHLNPNVAAPHSSAVRSRLKLSRDVSYQSMRLARTEMSNAFREGTVLGHRATPSYEGSIWEISGGHPFVDDCDDLAVGENGFGFYSAGNEPLAPHPNCMCVLSPVHRDPEAFTQDLERWLDDPSSSPDLEAWYQETARPLIGDQPIRPLSAPPRAPATIGAAPKATVSAGRGASAPTTRALQQAITAPTPRKAAELGSQAQRAADEAIETLAGDAGAAAAREIPEQYRAALDRVRTARRAFDEALDQHGANVDELRDALLELGRTARVEVKARLSRIKGHDALEEQIATAARAEQKASVDLRRLGEEIKDLRVGSEEWREVAIRYNAAIDARDLAEKQVLKLAKKVAPQRRRVIREVIGEVREVGGVREVGKVYRLRVPDKSIAGVTDDLETALDAFPREWLEASARRGQMLVRTASKTEMRGALGGYADQLSMIRFRGSGFERFNTLLHELGHRMQYSIGRYEYARPGGSDAFSSLFTKIEDSFRLYRAAGETPSAHAAYGAKDWIKDRFVEDYFGVMNPSGKSEMFTRGLEGLYNGRWSIYADDEEMLDYMLGLLMGL